jgi:predicted DNA-binding protein (UPF0251 family)
VGWGTSLFLAFDNKQQSGYYWHMPRPCKCRRIGWQPETSIFKPAGVPGQALEQVTLSLDELESVRLADLEGLYQEEAAGRMEVSRQTFGNIVASARRKLADCVVNGKLLRIQGGTVRLAGVRTFACSHCSHRWSLPFGSGPPETCPGCRSRDIHRTIEHEKGEKK